MRNLCRVACVVCCLTALARSELPPQAYERMREDAGEVLIVRVTRVDDTAKPDGGRAITVWADVVGVTRSANGKKTGDSVKIRYDLAPERPVGFVGPSPVGVPKATDTLTAWLKRDGTVYRPAAGRASFEKFEPKDTPTTQSGGK